jgi:hypothetical protein
MFVPESCELNREVQREALTGAPIGQPLSRERTLNLDVDAFHSAEDSVQRRALASVVAVQRGHRPWHVGKRFVRVPGDLPPDRVDANHTVRIGKARSRSQ